MLTSLPVLRRPGAVPSDLAALHPWTDAPRELLGPNTAQYYWRSRADFRPASWTLDLAVVVDGEVVGVQGLTGRDYPVTRSVETGSWLGRSHPRDASASAPGG